MLAVLKSEEVVDIEPRSPLDVSPHARGKVRVTCFHTLHLSQVLWE